MLYFDNQKFADKAKAAGVPVTFHAWDGMLHCFLCYLQLQPSWPELTEAIEELEKYVQSIF